MADLAPLLVTGGFTLLGSLGGVGLTQHFTVREARTNRAEQHKEQLRAQLSTLTHGCWSLIEASWQTIPAFAQFGKGDLLEFANSDTAKEFARRNEQIRTALAQLRCIAGNPELVTALGELERCLDDFPDQAHGPAFAAAGGHREPLNVMSDALSHVRLTRTMLQGVIEAAGPLLQVEVPDKRVRGYQRVLRPGQR
jgi:hypothetical protein